MQAAGTRLQWVARDGKGLDEGVSDGVGLGWGSRGWCGGELGWGGDGMGGA